MFLKSKSIYKKAFTMAEAILVMTILGIIAAVMLSTLKPTQWKDKSYQILAKKVLYEIDTATNTILTTNSKYNKFDSMVNDAGTGVSFDAAGMWTLYKKYLSTTRAGATAYCVNGNQSLTGTAYVLKDGACMGIVKVTKGTSKNVIFPGEINSAEMTSTGDIEGYIIFDTNNGDEPNVVGKDRFIVPFNLEGIKYE